MIRRHLWVLLGLLSCATATPAAKPDAGADTVADVQVSDTAKEVAADTQADAATDAAAVAPDVPADVAACPGGCDDANPCTDDSCSSVSGCVHAANAKACDDGKACTTGDHCAAGKCAAGVPSIWQLRAGGPADDAALAVVALADGSLVAAGWTESKGKGKHDAWLLGTDAAGKLAWDVAYGGDQTDEAYALQAIAGGYVFAGSTQSKGAGKRDGWLVRTDEKGQFQWESAFGGAQDEEIYGLAAVPDGFLLAGYSDSKVPGVTRMWIVRTDAAGKFMWDQTYGVTELDAAYGVTALADGGFAVIGETSPAGIEHLWLQRLDAGGKSLWSKSYHGSGNDTGWAIAAVADGFALAGYAHPNGEPKHPWLVRVDQDGKLLWEKTYGDGEAFGLAATATGLVLAGTAVVNGKPALGLRGVMADGKPVWDKQFGAGPQDVARALAVFPDGSLGVAGIGTALNDPHTDAWLLRLGPSGEEKCE